jgi:serine/threonine protein kinase
LGQVDHPNIVRANDAGEADGQFFLAMEFVEGVTLASLVRRLGPLGVADACEIVRQAAVGLQHVHEHGLVHRDVKPSNLMLTTTGVVKVLDLGLARLHVEECSASDATASGQFMGTADYSAPEQGSNARDADARADVYALGCTLYFALAGRPPFGDQWHNTFTAKVVAHAKEDAESIDRLRPDVPSQLAAVLNKMLAKSPASRCATAAEVAESLTPFCAGSDLSGLLTNRRMAHPIKPTATSITDSYLSDSPLKSPEVSAAPVATAIHKAWQIGLRLGSWKVFSFSLEVSTRTILQTGVGLVLLAIAGLWYGRGFLTPRRPTDIAMRSPAQNPKRTDTAQSPLAKRDAEPQGDRTPWSRSEPHNSRPQTPRPAYQEPADHQGRLTGMWQAAAGARFRIKDDGQSLRISLVQSSPLRKFTGELTRTEEKSDSFAGTLEAVFRPDASQKQYSIHVTATLDDSDHLRLRCADWPTWNNHGKYLGTRTLTETWTRQDAISQNTAGQDAAGQNVEAVSTYLRRTTLTEPIRAAMLTVVRQHPSETRWSGRAGTTMFGIAAKRLPKEPLAQRAIPAMLELTHVWAVHELLTAKSLLDRYSAMGLTDATTLRQAVVEAAGKLQVSGKANTVTHQASTEGNLAISYAMADEAALTAQLLQPDEIEKVRVAYRDVMHRQARELMQRSNWTDALLLWQHLHKRQLVSQQLYLDAACCFKQLNQVPDMILVLSEAIDTFGKNATPEFLEKAGDMALAIETEQAQALAAKAYRMASEQLNETISAGGERAAQADQQR